MAEYIQKDYIVLHCEGLATIAPNDFVGIAKYFADQIIAIPAADVEPVRHGRWIVLESYRDGGTAQRCSECRELMYFYRTTPRNHCPNCGAKMDGGGGDA